MCLIALAWRAHPAIELLLVGNRDEFHDRPAEPAQRQSEQPLLIGGRDLRAGGSWLEFVPGQRLAAVTNVRRTPIEPPQPRSRGALVSDFVRDARPWSDYRSELAAQAADYGRFNLLAWDGADLYSAGNVPGWHQAPVAPGVHALSNAELDSPWPKVRRVGERLHAWLQQLDAEAVDIDVEALFAAFADTHPAADAELPDTGIGLQRERWLSPPFIRGELYGTRCTSVVLQRADGHWYFEERRFAAGGEESGRYQDSG